MNRTVVTCWVQILAGLVLGGASALAAENLVANGDFEEASAARPPTGWVMWGAEQYKDPANYTRDPGNPHSGTGCFRIRHPAGTAGYIVLAPEKAIEPQPDRTYAICFWARADPPGPAVFQWVAYESVRPFVDAPWPGREILEVGTQWQRFEFAITEGWDFYASRVHFLMPSFVATVDAAPERTLWLDDISVTAAPSAREGRLMDERALQYEPLSHRLASGDRLEFTVDAAKPLRPTTRLAGGISFHRVCGWTGQPYDRQGNYTLDPRIEEAIRDLKLPMTRFYGVGDEPFGVEGALDRVAELVGKVGVPQPATVLELETQGATSRIAPAAWAQAAAYCRQRGYGFRCWEVANEPYLRRAGAAYATPDDYARQVEAVSQAIRQVQPEARIGIAITDDLKWGNYLLKSAAGSYDFVVHHYYASVPQIHRRRFEVAVLTENYALLDRVLRVQALIRAYNPGREVTQLDTEWGVHSAGPKGEVADAVDRNANIVGTLHRAVRLLYYAREGLLEGASSWQMLSRVSHQGFGVLAQEKPEQRFMIYWLYHTFNACLGDLVLETRGTAPYYTPAQGDDPLARAGAFPGPLTPVLATLSGDRREVCLMAVNGSWEREVPLRATLAGFAAASVSGVYLSSPDLDARPLLERKEDLVHELRVGLAGPEVRCDVPPHSVSFVRIAAR